MEEKVKTVFDGAEREIPQGLKEAVHSTLEIRRVISSFRSRCLSFREEGLLHAVVEAWYVENYVPDFYMDGYLKSFECRNPYAAFKSKNAGFTQLYSQLDFLLEEIPTRQSDRFTLPTSENDVAQLMTDLSLGGGLARLICTYPYLTHDENVALAVLDARLWLRSSQLPVVIGSKVSYNQLRKKRAPLPSRDSYGLPSTFYVSLQEGTVDSYYSMELHPKLTVCHLAPSDFPQDDRDSFWGRAARVRYPHLVHTGTTASEYAAKLHRVEDDFSQLEDWRENETSVMYKRLAAVIYDCTPEMHEANMMRLACDEDDEE